MKNMKDKPNYYSVIPAVVRYADIPDAAKLLYGEISALSNVEGYCYAGNNYFAELYGVSVRTISRNINILEKENFVDVEITRDEETGQVAMRKIYLKNVPRIVQIPDDVPVDKNVHRPVDKNVQTPIDKNVQYNNTLFNTTSILSPDAILKFDSVTLSKIEYGKLVKAHGEAAAKMMIEKLDAYKSSKGKKYKSDYKAILNWVVKWYNDNHGKDKQNNDQGDYTYEY